jgi:phosphoribosylaminoimidazole carboxylase (NCAIR synthetase)
MQPSPPKLTQTVPAGPPKYGSSGAAIHGRSTGAHTQLNTFTPPAGSRHPGPVTLLVLNKRRHLGELPRWFPDSARELVVLTAAAALTGAPDGVARRFRHLEVVEDYTAPATEEVAERLGREHRVDAVLSAAESDVVRAARLRQRLGLTGQGLDSAVAYRDKYRMKTLAAAAGIPVAPFRKVHHGDALREFAEQQGYPVVLKPIDGGSAQGLVLVCDRRVEDDVVAQWRRRPLEQPMLAEAFIDGPVFQVNGVMNAGEVVHGWPSRYLNPQWRTMTHCRTDVSGMLPASDTEFDQLQKAAAAVIGALPAPPNGCAFHAEFFRPDGGEPILCEIACRPGGSLIVETYEFATGVNLYEASLKGQAGRMAEVRPVAEFVRYGYACIPPQRGVLTHVPPRCPVPGTVHYDVRGVVGRAYHGPASVSDAVAGLIWRLRDDDLLEQLQAVERWSTEALRWTGTDPTTPRKEDAR